ncbi:unnamed protein product [Phytophthora lilii]|uniref:Unnamed protein product n=1 Tax=Phytophthora lilii TaxID=2077276 RepID=A0A9W6XBE6_9STRA|nr:unnamed protein product [Phytophthora lilii]
MTSRVVLLAVAAFFGRLDAASTELQIAAYDSNVLSASLTTTHDVVVRNRFLRTHTSTTDEEERGISTSAVESLTNSLKSTFTSQQLDDLLQKGNSVDDVFKLMSLDNAADGLLANPHLTAWIDYMKRFNKAQTVEKGVEKASLIAILTKYYGDDGVARIVEAAKKVSSTSRRAKNLEAEQIQHWLVKGKTPEDVYKLLKLDVRRYDLFDKPELATWVKYMDEFNKANPDNKATFISSLVNRYDEVSLTNMLMAAKEVPATEKLAVQMLTEQTQYWLEMKKAPRDIFELLRLNKEGDALLKSPLFSAWIRYTDDFKFAYPDETLDTMTTLLKYYLSADIARMSVEASKVPRTRSISDRIVLELFREWRSGGTSPAGAFVALGLKNAGTKIFEDPLFLTWHKYTAYYNSMDRSNKKVDEVFMLRGRFGDKRLSQMLMEAMNDQSMKSLAIDLQKQLLVRWRYFNKKPEKVFSWLLLDGTNANVDIRKLYDKYDDAYTNGEKLVF